MRVIVAGSRTIADYEVVAEAIRCSGFEITEIVSGGAKGVDRLGEQYAAEHGLIVKQFPTNWRPGGKYDRGAGLKNNATMLRYADALIAIWDGTSKGTADMIGKMKRAEKKVYVHRVEAASA